MEVLVTDDVYQSLEVSVGLSLSFTPKPLPQLVRTPIGEWVVRVVFFRDFSRCLVSRVTIILRVGVLEVRSGKEQVGVVRPLLQGPVRLV
jgi:hypothetical protein